MTIGFIVYSDYLCPWCYNAFVRLSRIEEEYGPRVDFEWRSYLLRPNPRRPEPDGLALEKFRRYTQSWQRPAAEPDSGDFGSWKENVPPSHSLPPQMAARAAARYGRKELRSFQRELFTSYFSRCLDISSEEILAACWKAAELPADGLSEMNDPALCRAVLADHREAVECGATGVPGVRLRDNPAIVVGAQPVELYRRWIERQFAGAERADSRGIRRSDAR